MKTVLRTHLLYNTLTFLVYRPHILRERSQETNQIYSKDSKPTVSDQSPLTHLSTSVWAASRGYFSHSRALWSVDQSYYVCRQAVITLHQAKPIELFTYLYKYKPCLVNRWWRVPWGKLFLCKGGSLLYLLARWCVVMRDLLRWQGWNNPPSPWRGGTRAPQQLLRDFPSRTLQGTEIQIQDILKVKRESFTFHHTDVWIDYSNIFC